MIELLAPAGNVESLKAAIYAGANAVYLGFGKFNARQKADGFNESNIKECVDLCHLHGVKVYITFNTLIKDSEFSDFEKDVKTCVDANVDAFIVTDLGTLDIFKQYSIPLHASTQMGIHNYEGAKIAKELGFSRVVLSREALISDIKKIKTLGIEIEYFVHGALCVSFSGGCLLSSFLSGDSGNRGLCKQSCRLKYKSDLTNEEKYYLSTSDQCLIEKLDQLIDSGVISLKIEGRLKSASYVGEVVNQYRKYLDGKQEKDYMSYLRRAYNRGYFTKGYNFDDTNQIMSPNVQGNQGEYIGDIVKTKNKTLYIKSNRGLVINDGLKIFNKGKELGGFRVDNIKREENLYLVNTIKTYPIGSKVYLTADEELKNKYENINLDLKIDINYSFVEGQKAKIAAKYKNVYVEYEAEQVLIASNKPINKEDVELKLSQINGTGFVINSINGEVSNNAFYPLSKIKELKRIVIDLLKTKILDEYNSKKERVIFASLYNLRRHGQNGSIFNKNLVEIKFEDYVKLIQKNDIIFDKSQVDFVVKFPDNIVQYNQSIMKKQINYNNLEKYILKLPKVCRGSDLEIVYSFIDENIGNIKGFLCENLYAIEIANKYTKQYILGQGMNVFNSKVPYILNSEDFVYSLELSKNDYKPFGHIYSFGKPLMMTLSHCPIKLNLNSNCSDCKYNGSFSYKIQNNTFVFFRTKLKYCYFEMFRDTYIDLRKVISNISNNLYIDVTTLDFESMQKICKSFIDKETVSIENSNLGHYNLTVK